MDNGHSKKNKSGKGKKVADDKENVNVSRIAPRRRMNPPLNDVHAAPSSMEPDGGTPIPYEDWNLFANEFYNMKRSIQDLDPEKFIIDITNENYWKNLPEKDRKALVSALSENRDLHDRINQLEGENVRLKSLLDEARSLVDVLTELVEEEGVEALDELL